MDELILARKLKLWQNRLLDLSKRNRMISFKDSSSQVIRFNDPGFEELYQKLVVNGRSMQIKRAIDRNVDPAVYAMMRLMHHLSENMDIGKGDILAAGSLETSARTVRNIKKYADLSLQEKGTNILYLAFGFLYWRDRDTRGDWLKAPLVLVPASLTQSSVNQPFAVKKTEEDIIVNPTFAYYLEVNHGVHLPELKSTNKLQDVLVFLQEVSHAVERLGWRVEQEVYLSTMSFLKTNMYNDLVANEARIMSHPIIRAFAGDRNEFTTLDESATDFRHDDTSVEHVFEVLNADSSQKDAVELSHRGISFVMQGPPGTGKSQTITNIIAQGMAEGKKILFVSEKQAALDVVYHRLRDVGISDLCLPLHDPKTSKQVVLKQLEKNLDAPKTRVGNDRLAELHQLAGLKTDLNAYAHLLHDRVQPLDMSLYEAYQMLFSLAEVPDVIFAMPKLASISRADMNRMIREASEYEASRDALGERWYAHPWFGIKKQNLSNAGKQRLKAAMETLYEQLKVFGKYEISQEKHLSDVITWNNRQEYEAIGRLIAGFSVVPQSMVLETENWNADELPDEIKSVIERLAGFYGCSEQDLLTNIDKIKAHSIAAAELFKILSSVMEEIEGLDKELSYLQIFQLQELMYQFGLDVRTLSVTEHYFTSEGISEVLRIKDERTAQFEQANRLRMRLLQRYGEGVLGLRLNIGEDELSGTLEQLRHPRVNDKAELGYILETEHGIRVVNKADPEEMFSVVKALLSGEFDHFAHLSENEFYFVYDLLEEARQKEADGDEQWFVDFGSTLLQYTGQSVADAAPGAWDKFLVLANDYYYVKTAYPELMQITRLRTAQKERLQQAIDSLDQDDSLATRIRNELQRFSLSGQNFAADVICEDVQEILEYQSIFESAECSYMEDVSVVGNQYLMASTDWTLVENNIEFAREVINLFARTDIEGIRALLVNATKLDWEVLNDTLTKLLEAGKQTPSLETIKVHGGVRVLQENAASLEYVKEQSSAWREMCYAAQTIKEAVYKDGEVTIDKEVLCLMLENSSTRLFDVLDLLCALTAEAANLQTYLDVYDDPEVLMDMTISNLRDRLNACIEQFSEYDTMVEYQVCAEHCREDGLNAFISKAYQLRKEGKILGKMFEKAFLTLWIDMVSENYESISAFSSRAHGNKIGTFSELDKKQLMIARERVLATSYGRMPSRSAGKVVGEMGTLLREISKSRNAMTIRQLFNSIPNLLTTLKPCLMMSPLSVAYFLNADLYCFDMVIFDEASQIFPENAIGAILRGKQVIISGDSKQMPPTSFFQTALGSQEEEDEDDIAANSDSILEEAENVLPNLSLTWHYRSRNESLITFSNRNMYSGSLVTFPNNAPNGVDTGVEYHYVENGVFDNRCNEEEAYACVALTIEHFRNHPDRSIGIIAFSLSQEECIERAFDEYRTNHPQYESFFKETRENPFFIKNLENVQGDERDTILLSVGYARNTQGILRYNFGPLGMQGGERRMNVAITRAKHNIKLVTSLRPEDFDKSRTESNAGAKLLYDYIVYAMYGPGIGVGAIPMSTDDGFKQYIVKTIADAGYKTAFNIGNSGYKVEIAVEDPNHEGSYIVGIETDGLAYEGARTVRDRECLRPDMLKSMGWNMYRVWSTQWIRDPETEKKKLLEFIAEQITKSKAVDVQTEIVTSEDETAETQNTTVEVSSDT